MRQWWMPWPLHTLGDACLWNDGVHFIDSVSAKQQFDLTVDNCICVCYVYKYPLRFPLHAPQRQVKELTARDLH